MSKRKVLPIMNFTRRDNVRPIVTADEFIAEWNQVYTEGKSSLGEIPNCDLNDHRAMEVFITQQAIRRVARDRRVAEGHRRKHGTM